MTGILIHDGRRPGHLKWSKEAVASKVANGVVLNPFSTPRISIPRNPRAADVRKEIAEIGGEIIFDPMSHAYLMDETDRLDFYDDWNLWGPHGKGLDTNPRRREHIERVFQHQDSIGAPNLAPTISVNAPLSANADHALETAQLAQSISPSTWQSLAGTRAFWASGSRLDAHVGYLASLGSPVWIITLVNDSVEDYLPDLANTTAIEGLLRSVHSLSLRSRVIIAYADLAGLPAVAAGADTVGSGWDRGQRTFDPMSFKQGDGTPRRSASYVTHGGLLSILRRDAADAIVNWDSLRAQVMRGGNMPPSDEAQRTHHFQQLKTLIDDIIATPNRIARVRALRSFYEEAARSYEDLIRDLNPTIDRHQKSMWIDSPAKALEAYAKAESLWQ